MCDRFALMPAQSVRKRIQGYVGMACDTVCVHVCMCLYACAFAVYTVWYNNSIAPVCNVLDFPGHAS